MKLVFFSFFVFGTLFQNQVALSATTKTPVQALNLKQALDIAMKQNFDLTLAGQGFEQQEIAFHNAWKSFYLPTVSLSTTSTSALTLGHLPATPAEKNTLSTANRGYPNSAIQLTVGTYTLFNFFRDRIAYDNTRLGFERSAEQLNETRRSIKFRVMNAYYGAKLNQEKLEAAERSLSIAQTILQLVKSRVDLKTATQNEYDSAVVDANDAKLQLESLRTEYQTSLYSLNLILNQAPDTQLNLTTPLDYKPLTISYAQAYGWYKEHSPTMRNLTLQNQVAQGNLEIAEKNRMPLPTVTFNGVSVGIGNRYSGAKNSYSSSGTNTAPGQIDIETSVNLTLPIFGPGGFFGSDTVKSARINVDQSEVLLQSATLSGDVQIRSYFFQLKQIQDQLKTLKETFDSTAQLLDRVVTQMSSQKANRLELRDALERARNNEISLLQTTYNYTQTRNALYELIGSDLEGL